MEALGHRGQHVVTGPVAVARVHGTETIDVDHEDADASPPGTVEGGLEALLEDHAIRKAGQRVAVGPAAGVVALGGDLAPAPETEEHEGESDQAQEQHGLLKA